MCHTLGEWNLVTQKNILTTAFFSIERKKKYINVLPPLILFDLIGLVKKNAAWIKYQFNNQ